MNSRNKAEEFKCAKFIDELPDVEFWCVIPERQPIHSFWLQTSTDRFYPDFIIKLKSGKILVVEYKGEVFASNDDSKEKRDLATFGRKACDGACEFLFIKGPEELDAIAVSAI